MKRDEVKVGGGGGGLAMEFEAMMYRGSTTTLKEHDYIGLSEASSSSSGTSCTPAVPDLNESATVLRLGPPKPDDERARDEARAPPPLQQRNSAILEEFRKAQAMKAQQQQQQVSMYKAAFQAAPYNVFKAGYGVKRGFSETVVVGDHVKVQQQASWMHGPYVRTSRPAHVVLDATDSSSKGKKSEAVASDPPAPGQTVGWPPVRSFVKNNAPVKPTSPPPSSTTDSPPVQEKETPSPSAGAKSLFVKIYMDGVPFGRKVDLRTNNRYEKLYSALEEMFHQFINGHYSGSQTATSSSKSHFVPSGSSSSRKLNFLDGSEYVLIYEDHEGDFMLVGDVPWELFVNTVKRLRIMKGSEEVNLAPNNTDPVKTQPAVG